MGKWERDQGVVRREEGEMYLKMKEVALINPLDSPRWAVSKSSGIKLEKRLSQHVFS